MLQFGLLLGLNAFVPRLFFFLLVLYMYVQFETMLDLEANSL